MAEQAYTYCDECGATQVGLGMSCHRCGERWTSWSVARDGERIGHADGMGWKGLLLSVTISLIMWGVGIWIGWRLFG